MHQFELYSGAAGPALTAEQRVYKALWKAIVEHRLLPATRLPEDALAQSFAISRTGIRRVLQRLAHERLITLIPHRGAHVSQPSPEEARQVFEARRLLEVSALPLVVAGFTEADESRLQDICDAEHAAIHLRQRGEAIRLSGRFHISLISISGNEPLRDTLAQLITRSSLIIALYADAHECGCLGPHAGLIELIANAATAEAQARMDAHINALYHTLSFEQPASAAFDFDTLLQDTPDSRPREQTTS